MDALKRFFDKIGFEYSDDFSNTKVEKVVVNNKKETWDVHLNSKEVLPIDRVLNLIDICDKGLEDISKINITFLYENISNERILEYTRYYINILTKKYPSLISLIDNEIYIDETKIIFEVVSQIEADLIIDNSKKIIKWLKSVGITDYEILAEINDEKRQKIKEEIENTKEIVVIKSTLEYQVIMGEEIKSKVTKITDIMGEENNVTLEAYIFGIEEFSSTKSNFRILTLKIAL